MGLKNEFCFWFGTTIKWDVVKRLLLLLTLSFCSLATAQFRERPATTALRESQLATHVEGNLWKIVGFPVDGRVSALGFSPKGDYLAVATATTLSLFNETATRKMVIWDAIKHPEVPFEDRPLVNEMVAFSLDGKQLFHCGRQGLSVWVWPEGVSLDLPPVRVWTAPNVYNVVVIGDNRVVCAAKKGSSHLMQLRGTSDGAVVWEKESGLLPITSLRRGGSTVRAVVGTLSGSQCFWSDWNVEDGQQSLPVDLGSVNGFSASQSPDGRSLAVVSRDLSIITLETGESKVAVAPYHPYRRRHLYYYDWPYYSGRWVYAASIDTGWTTLFSPDGNSVVTLGKEAVFYGRNSGVIEARIYYSNDPFPLPPTTQAEADGVGGFSPDGNRFALVRQARVSYASIYNKARQEYVIQRQVQGASAVEIYALGAY